MTDYAELNQQTYDWCARAFEQLSKLLGVRIRMTHEPQQLEQGEIFLFNHFARMETFIPQYLIYQQGGHYCRSVASAEFFQRDDRFARLLRDLGVVPNNHPQLMSLLARDILRGRKVVMFPEGGMVKDRQVIDEQGEYSVFSRHAQTRRKHHTGAARLATGLQIFRYAIKQRMQKNQHALLRQWADELGLSSVNALLAGADRAVTIVPANITFYPLRISDNLLSRTAELLGGSLSKRALDELVVEGNILLKATDMDINLGTSLCVAEAVSWYERPLLNYLARDLTSLASVFDSEFLEHKLPRRLANRSALTVINRLRDRYMREIYQTVSVNLSHLASTVLITQFNAGHTVLGLPEFRLMLYLAVKHVQRDREIRLHAGLCDPGRYQALLASTPPALEEFLLEAAAVGLLRVHEQQLHLEEKLRQTPDFDEIRLQNPLEVYANEVEPLPAVARAVARAMTDAGALSGAQRAEYLFDDELKALDWDRALYRKPKHVEINERETATADPSPFLLRPAVPKPVGVVLVHGFLATPAEVRAFGGQLQAAGYPVLGVRLKGHGTSPWDLRQRSWEDWLQSIARGVEIMRGITERYVLIGFSTGGSLSLIQAAKADPALAGTIAISAPLKFRNKNLRFVPFMHGANRLVSWLSSYEGVMPFRPNESEHPHINYRNIPLRGLYELTRVVSELKTMLPRVRAPVCVIQGDGDAVVDPESAQLIYDKLEVDRKALHWVSSKRHGILYEDIGATRQLAIDFLAAL